MPPALSLSDAFDKESWDLDEIRMQLQADSSSVNIRIDAFQGALLHRVLGDPRCTPDIVRLLLKYGADPNMRMMRLLGSTPLLKSLYCKDRIEIVKALVEAGARIDKYSLRCALDLEVELEVLQLFVRAGADFTQIDGSGQCPLFHALGYKNFDVGAYAYLLDLQHRDIRYIRNERNENLLLCAIRKKCSAKFVSFLIARGVSVDAMNVDGNNPLHEAVKRPHPCQLEIVVTLLKSGAYINSTNVSGVTPLCEAVMHHNCDLAVIKELLDAGASIVCYPRSVLEMVFFKMDEKKPSTRDLSVFQLILKYCLVDSTHWIWEEEYATRGHILHRVFKKYTKKCIYELLRIDKENVGDDDLTLLDFLQAYQGRRLTVRDYRNEGLRFDVNKIFHALARNSYPVYSDVILGRLDRSLLVAKFEEHDIASEMSGSDMQGVALDFQCLRIVASFLSNTDLLNVNIAFICINSDCT